MLYNIRIVRPYLTQEAAQVLIQGLISRLDYCNSLLAGLPACAIKPLRLIQNAAARLVFNLPKLSHPTPPHSLLASSQSLHPLWCLTTEQQEDLPLPTFRLCSNPTPRALRSATSGLLASHPYGRAAPAQPSPSSSLSWHPNGGTSLPLKLGQQSLCPSSKNI